MRVGKHYYQFAHDTKIAWQTAENNIKIQEDLDKVIQWAKTSKLHFKKDKCMHERKIRWYKWGKP